MTLRRSSPRSRSVAAVALLPTIAVATAASASMPAWQTPVAERAGVSALRVSAATTSALYPGGMGDVLTGVCAGLIGQGLSLYDAARVGAWLCGRSAEIAIFQGGASEQSLLPSDVLDNLGRAFGALEIESTL